MTSNILHKKAKFCIPFEAYKRSNDSVKSPFRYPGGKFYALKYILPFISCVSHDEYREPFVGGGNVFFAKSKCKHNWLNDLESDLIETYRVLANKKLREKLISLLIKEVANKTRHKEIQVYKPRTQLERAYKTYYLNRTSYCGIINHPAWGYKEGKSSPPHNWKLLIEPAGEKLARVKLTDKDFEKVITAESQGENVLMYLDPPYFHADQKRAFTKHFLIEDHIRLASLLKRTEYFFCLSYDDCKEIRDLYSWAQISERSWLYQTANKRNERREKGKELIITNYEVDVISQMSLFK